MKDSEKIKGIVFAYNTTGEYDMVKEVGCNWLRMHVSFPWKDRMNGTLTEEYIREREEIRKLHAYGFEIMVTTPGLGGFRFDEKRKETVFRENFPEFAGERGSDEFYENVRKTTAFYAEDLTDCAGLYWQCMNEIDNPIFAGHYSDRVVTMTARASAEGIVRVRPEARCGVNLSQYNENAIRIADLVYAPGHCFYYVGDDQYFGSWQPGDVSRWTEVIDAIYERYQMPVLANEWGYSSGGRYSTEHVNPKLIPFGLPEECFTQSWFHEAEGGHTDEVQADYIYKGLKLFAEHPHCIGSFLFCWRDAYRCYHCGGESCPSEDFWGIVTKDLKKKPAYFAVKKAFAEFYTD